MNKSKLKSMPSLKSDIQAEQFVESADLTEYDLSEFKPMRFEIESKDAARATGIKDRRVNIRLSSSDFQDI